MQPKFKFISTTLFALLSFSAVVAAIVSLDAQTFESDLVRSLKEKFKTFYTRAEQDRVYVHTDKTFYKPGETVWLSAYLRNEATLKPSMNSDIIHVQLITPKGSVSKHLKVVAVNGSARGDFDLQGYPGGIYKIKAYTEWQKNDTAALVFEKEITVQSVVMPRLKMKLDFEKKAYGKGDEVVAKLELNTNNNTALSKHPVKFSAALDGNPLSAHTATTDAEGKAQLKFVLPANLNTIDGLVNVLIEYEGSTESISRSIPIVLNKIDVEFFPEGGDMVANVPSKIAFRALNEFGKPADVEGIIVDAKGAFVTKFSSYHFGMGSVTFAPKAEEQYRARITKPEGILEEFSLPEVAKNGYVMQVSGNSSTSVGLEIYSWQTEELSVIAQVRGKIFYAQSFKALRGNNQLNIKTQNFPVGVSQVTLFDSKGVARCERLVFVNRHQQLNVSITTDKKHYKPRENVAMTIRVTDENGLPVSGNFSLSVVDDNLLSYADDKQGNILSKMLLEPELNEKVEEPNFYFDVKEEKSARALDLLLLTSGWRKYTWKQITRQEFPAIQFAAEKAELSGVVYEAHTSKPIPGAVVKLTENGRLVTTGAKGEFKFSGFDLAVANKIQVSAPGYNTQTQTISNYGDQFNFYLYDDRYKHYLMEEPMAVELQAVAVRRMDMVAVKAQKRGVQKEKANAAIDVADAADMVDIAEAIDNEKEPEEEAKEEENIEGDAIAGDTRIGVMDDIALFDKNVGKRENEVVFYRAKEFAKKKYTAADTSRHDLTTTVYWNGNVETDRLGRAKVEFVTNDLISSFRATLEGFGDDGSVGRGEFTFSTQLPVSLDAKIPVEMISGDKLLLPVFLKNNTDDDITGELAIALPRQLTLHTKPGKVVLKAKDAQVIYLDVVANNEPGEGALEIKFISANHNDALTRMIKVTPKGFPTTISLSGQDMQKEFVINPINVVPGSMKITFNAYPNIMTELMSGVESILREPYGCFEQTSSSNYPNIMVLQYLKSMKIDDPKLEAKARQLLDNGYKKLVAFETKENGYEWFGAAPAHEALTAYGLMEFVDMRNVYAGVDDKMIERTAKLLFERRDGNGGFKKNPRALDSFGGADADITNAYIVYALTEAGYKDVEKELNAVVKEAKKSNDPYLMALCANALMNLGDNARGEEMISQLIHARNEAGFWTGKKHSITRSTGESLKTETTSLILLALLKSQKPDVESISSAVKFLVGARSGYGGFGSTQATILALKALTQYAAFSKKTDEAGTIEVLVNGNVVARKDFAKGERNNITIESLDKHVQQGKQKIEVRYSGCRQALPYAMNITYHTSLPESAKACVVSLETKLSARQVKVGETLRLSATLKNKTNDGQPMTMAIIGLPAGFTAQPWQLKEMKEKGVIDFYETIGNQIAFYYRSLAPQAQKQIHLDLKAEVPGEYDAPASSAYLYYTNEHKHWVGVERVFINR